MKLSIFIYIPDFLQQDWFTGSRLTEPAWAVTIFRDEASVNKKYSTKINDTVSLFQLEI